MRYVRQEGIRDCGVCCLYNIIRYYKGNIDIEKLRTLTKTNEEGTSIYNLVQAANKLGFKSKAYRCNINDIESLELPLIAYIKISNYYHFVIIDDLEFDKIVLFDPIRGRLNYTLDSFLKEWQNIVISFERKGNIIKEKNDYNNFLLDLFKNNKNKIITISILSFLCTIFSILTSVYIKRLIDLKNNKNIMFLFLVLLLISGGINYIRNIISINMNNKIDYELSDKVYNKLYSLPIKYHHNRPIGDIASRINDLYYIKDFISTFTITTIIDLLFIIIILFLLLFKSFTVFLLTLTITFLYSSLYYLLKKDEFVMLENLKEKNACNNSVFIDNLNGIETVKNLNIEDKIINKQRKSLFHYINSYKNLNKFILTENSLLSLIESIGLIIVMYRGYIILQKGGITKGDLSYIYGLYITLVSSLKSILNFDRILMASKLSFNRINTLLKINIKDPSIIKNIKQIETIKFTNIVISKSTLNFFIKKNDRVLINGKSGVGKSTIFKSLIKESNIEKGEILINDINVNDIKDNILKNNICYISQDEYIFNDSIKNNILMFKNIKSNDIKRAIKVSTLDKVLKKKNIDLDYILEENGHNLSGGEKQKIIITRALLSNADYIIFDETMNEIDIENERKILKNIFTEYNKTFILITHRNSNPDLFNKRVIIE